jgi:hypothetical protein
LCLLECTILHSSDPISFNIRKHCITQLLACEEWAYAVFVATQIEDPDIRTATVKPILFVSFA